MTIPALIYIDRWGRRPMLLYGAIIMGTWLYLVGGLQARFGHAAVDVASSDTTTWIVEGNKSATYAITGELPFKRVRFARMKRLTPCLV